MGAFGDHREINYYLMHSLFTCGKLVYFFWLAQQNLLFVEFRFDGVFPCRTFYLNVRGQDLVTNIYDSQGKLYKYFQMISHSIALSADLLSR